MLHFLTLSDDDSLTSELGNRHTVVGYDYDFTQAELDSTNITDAD